ncbi:ectoine synthase [Mesorhizobium sp. M0808]|uniref:ectoine synthase n=1 Tax=Mesorhizobium sp. M0808 TaxID=2957002 RepID=UPI00333795A4
MHYRNHLEAAIYCISGTGSIEGSQADESMSCDRTSYTFDKHDAYPLGRDRIGVGLRTSLSRQRGAC